MRYETWGSRKKLFRMAKYTAFDWYEQNIEEGIRPIVKLLRDNGYNTECSCAHDMYVQCQFIPGVETIQELHTLIWNYLCINKLPINFEIEIRHKVIDGKSFSSMDIKFDKDAKLEENYGTK